MAPYNLSIVVELELPDDQEAAGVKDNTAELLARWFPDASIGVSVYARPWFEQDPWSRKVA